MNPLAVELNNLLKENNPYVFDMLSDLGKNMFFPKGILSQSAEAKEKAHKFNATIGTATENGAPMYLQCIQDNLTGLDPKDVYPYAPPAGKPELRKLWQEKMLLENPSQKDKYFSLPVVTNALTHGLSIIADLFADTDDHVILPDMMWGNYNLTFVTRRNAVVKKYKTFTEAGGYNVAAFADCLKQTAAEKGKAIVILNFPNNPSGYTPSVEEGDAIIATLKEVAEGGCNLVVVTDDAYFGLFYEEGTLKESLFGKIANQHPRLLSIKLDGATKEEFVWGFRTGFITYADGSPNENADVLTALEKKTLGVIRGTISNCPHLSQTLVIKALQSPEFHAQKQQKFEILQGRALAVKKVLSDSKYDQSWSYYPFNSGYFMCLGLKRVDSETLRLHLLDKYGVGAISTSATDLRIAFSCIEEKDIQELFDLILQAEQDLA